MDAVVQTHLRRKDKPNASPPLFDSFSLRESAAPQLVKRTWWVLTAEVVDLPFSFLSDHPSDRYVIMKRLNAGAATTVTTH